MNVKLKCGEVYPFHIIKSIVDQGNGTVEIKGNFKPRGRYKDVTLFIISIENWEQVKDFYPINKKSYFCKECNRMHSKGKVFKEHGKFRKKEDKIPSHRILKFDPKRLRNIARDQLVRLFHKLKTKTNKSLYRREINKLLIFEGVVIEDVL